MASGSFLPRSFLRLLPALALPLLIGAAEPRANDLGELSFLDGDRRVTVDRLGAKRRTTTGTCSRPCSSITRAAGRSTRSSMTPRSSRSSPAPSAASIASARAWCGRSCPRSACGSPRRATVPMRSRSPPASSRRTQGRAAAACAVHSNLYVEHGIKDGPHTPNDPRYGGQWYFDNLHMPDAWGLTQGDPSSTIVIVDTGCDLEHPDLKAKLDPGRDVADQDDDPSAVVSEEGASHGTSCAGIAGAATDNGEGIAGGCPACRLRCVRLLNGKALPLSADIEAFQFAFDKGASVVSNSWGYKEPTPVPAMLASAINNVYENGRGGKGALVLFAAGNDDRELGDDELEAVKGVLCIGAINNFEEQTPFTNFGKSVDLVAPTGTLTTDIHGAAGDDPTDYTNHFGGTSSSCPVAAGIAGLLVSVAPDSTSAELYQVLIDTARPAPYATPDANGHDLVYGYGIIDPVKALKKVLHIEDPPDGGAGGAGGSGGGSTTTTTTATTSSGGSTPPDDTGCGCSLPGRGSNGEALVLYAGLLGLAASRRRRR
ncbi:MAG: S8 family serine peptidase [Byssovorax sp.]